MVYESCATLFGDIHVFRADTGGYLEGVKELTGIPVDNISASFDGVHVLSSFNNVNCEAGCMIENDCSCKEKTAAAGNSTCIQQLFTLSDGNCFFESITISRYYSEPVVSYSCNKSAAFTLGSSRKLLASHDGGPSTAKRLASISAKAFPTSNNSPGAASTHIEALGRLKINSISAAEHFTVVATNAGDLYSWGRGYENQLGRRRCISTTPRFIYVNERVKLTQVACGNFHSLALSSFGEVYAWGSNALGQLGIEDCAAGTCKPLKVKVGGLEIRKVAAGWAHSLVLSQEGVPYSWGFNFGGQLGLGDFETRRVPHLISHFKAGAPSHSNPSTVINQIAAGLMFSSFLSLDGSIWFVGKEPGKCSKSGNVEAKRRVYFQGSSTYSLPRIISGNQQFSRIVCSRKTLMAFASTKLVQLDPLVVPNTGGMPLKIGLRWGNPVNERARFERASFLPTLKLLRPSPNQLISYAKPGKSAKENLEEDNLRIAQVQFSSSVPPKFIQLINCELRVREGIATINALSPELNRAAPPILKSPFPEPKYASHSQGRDDGYHHSNLLSPTPFVVQVSLDACRSWTPRHSDMALLALSFPDSVASVRPDNITAKGNMNLNIYLSDSIPILEKASPLVKFSFLRQERKPSYSSQQSARKTFRSSNDEDAECVFFSNGKIENDGSISALCPSFDKVSTNNRDLFVDVALSGMNFTGAPAKLDVVNLQVTGLKPDIGNIAKDTVVLVQTDEICQSESCFVRLRSSIFDSEVLPATIDTQEKALSFTLPSPNSRIQAKAQSEQAIQDIKQQLALAGVDIAISFNGIEFSEESKSFRFYDQLTFHSIHATDPKSWNSRKEVALTEPLHPGSTISAQISGCPGSDFAKARFYFLQNNLSRLSDGDQQDLLLETPTVVPAEMRKGTLAGAPRKSLNAEAPNASHIIKFAVPHPPEHSLSEVKASIEISVDGQHFIPLYDPLSITILGIK